MIQNPVTPLFNDVNGNLIAPVLNAAGALPTASAAVASDTGALLTYTNAATGTNGADKTNATARGIKIVVDITAISGTAASLTVTLQGKDAASGKYYTILASAALTTVSTTVLTVFPAATASANVSVNDELPAIWRVIATIAGTTPAVTATVGASLLA